MDPRLNPGNLGPRPGVGNDIKPAALAPQLPASPAAPMPQTATPPATAPLPAQPAAPTSPISTPEAAPSYQIVGQIPLAQPGGTAPAPQTESAKPDDELDKILQAVNNRVQAPVQINPKATKKILSKVSAKVPKPGTPKSPRPLGAMVVVIIVVLVLSALAVQAYRQGNKKGVLSNQASKVGTSYQAAASIQAAGGKLVSPADLDNYSQDLSSKLNSLNDSQDFSPDALSSSVLGL